MSEAFTRKGLDSPRLLSELLMSHVIGCDRLRLYMEADRPASELERATLRDLVGRALKHEPVQYLVGEAWFFGLPMKSDRRALIPRPSTEPIVEEVLTHARATHGTASAKGDGLLLADVCTGTGCIIIALLKNLPQARGVGTDLSPEALELATENAQRHGVAPRLDLLRGDLLQPLLDHPAMRGEGGLDYLTANPPYIPDFQWPSVDANVREYEPALALRGGPDGLDFVRTLIAAGPRLVRPGGLLLIEVADVHAEQALALARDHEMLESTRLLRDHENLPRVVVGRKRS